MNPYFKDAKAVNIAGRTHWPAMSTSDQTVKTTLIQTFATCFSCTAPFQVTPLTFLKSTKEQKA